MRLRKLIEKFNASVKPLVFLVLPIAFAGLYQNCGKGFKPFEDASLSSGSQAELEFTMSDTLSASNDYMRSDTVSFTINGVTNGKSFCISESQVNAPSAESCSGGAGPANGWFTQVPTTVTLSAGEGAKRVYLWWKNEAGEVRGGISKEVIVDLTDPAITVAAPPGAYVRNQTFSMAFTSSDSQSGIARAECRIDVQTFAPCETSFDFQNLAEGAHSFTIRVFDRAGRMSERVLTTSVDITL
ncbi:MAG: hypothetical protein ABL958_07145, partial [Bdellovibrionia bacterium]